MTREARLEAAIRWALGEADSDFRERQIGEGPYYWRRELRERAFGADAEAVSQPSEPVVERMCEAFMSAPEAQGKHIRIAMKPAYEVARAEFDQQLQQKLSERDKEWEQAIGLVWEVFPEHQWTLGSFVSECRARLDRKRERVEVIDKGSMFHVMLDGKNEYACLKKIDAERYAAGLRAEIGGEK